jgi:hypothetical protein
MNIRAAAVLMVVHIPKITQADIAFLVLVMDSELYALTATVRIAVYNGAVVRPCLNTNP